jgi:hypothetical protein
MSFPESDRKGIRQVGALVEGRDGAVGRQGDWPRGVIGILPILVQGNPPLPQVGIRTGHDESLRRYVDVRRPASYVISGQVRPSLPGIVMGGRLHLLDDIALTNS